MSYWCRTQILFLSPLLILCFSNAYLRNYYLYTYNLFNEYSFLSLFLVFLFFFIRWKETFFVYYRLRGEWTWNDYTILNRNRFFMHLNFNLNLEFSRIGYSHTYMYELAHVPNWGAYCDILLLLLHSWLAASTTLLHWKTLAQIKTNFNSHKIQILKMKNKKFNNTIILSKNWHEIP